MHDIAAAAAQLVPAVGYALAWFAAAAFPVVAGLVLEGILIPPAAWANAK